MFPKFPAHLSDLVQAVDSIRQDAVRQFADLQVQQQQYLKAFKAAGFGALRPMTVSFEEQDGATVTVLTLVLPGLDNQNVEINVVDKQLVIKATYPENNPLGLVGEIDVAYPIPGNADMPRIAGELKNGVLRVELPSLPEVAKAAIPVPLR